MRSPNLAKLQNTCDAFNALYPVGTPGVLRRDNGERQATRTTSPAEVLGGHSAVIRLADVRGCYALDRFSPDP